MRFNRIDKLMNLGLTMGCISVYDTNSYTLQELISTVVTETNNLIDELEKVEDDVYKQLDYLTGKGLNIEVAKKIQEMYENGELSEVINEQLFSNLNDKIKYLDNNMNSVNNNLPYEEYSRIKEVELDGKYKNYQGYSNHSKRTYGRYEQATVMSVIANKNNPIPQVLGTNTKGLATYTNRDSVSLYTENTGGIPILTIASGMVYTDIKATVPTGIDTREIKPGMIIDVGTKVNDDWCVGIIKEINGRELIMEDGFYKVRNDGIESVKVIPENGLQARIQMTNKVWVINSNLFVDAGCPAGANLELGVLCNHSNINDVGGIDLINMRESTHYGIKVRGSKKGFQRGFSSSKSGVHFEGIDSSKGGTFLRTINDDNSSFIVKNNGELSQLIVKTVVVNSSTTLTTAAGYVFMQGNNINITLPNMPTGQRIVFVSEGTGNLLTAVPGSGIKTVDVYQQQISISKSADKQLRTMELISLGTSWRVVSDYK